MLLVLPSPDFRIRVLWDSRPYFTVSDVRRPFLSPSTTRRVTVEVFDPASIRRSGSSCVKCSLYSIKADRPKTPLLLLLRRRVYRAVPWQRNLFDCCLYICCLAMDVSSDFTIPDFELQISKSCEKHEENKYCIIFVLRPLLSPSGDHWTRSGDDSFGTETAGVQNESIKQSVERIWRKEIAHPSIHNLSVLFCGHRCWMREARPNNKLFYLGPHWASFWSELD
jgi:hypothetical protein